MQYNRDIFYYFVNKISRFIFVFQSVATFVNKTAGYRMMPGYNSKLKPLREECHPAEYIVAENGSWAQSELQEVCNHTATRAFLEPEMQEIVNDIKARFGKAKFTVKYKVGFDSAGGKLFG